MPNTRSTEAAALRQRKRRAKLAAEGWPTSDVLHRAITNAFCRAPKYSDAFDRAVIFEADVLIETVRQLVKSGYARSAASRALEHLYRSHVRNLLAEEASAHDDP
jgi:hypothetical protein